MTWISSAPPARRARAHSDKVAPVVSTSSRMATRAGTRPSLAANTPSRLRRRSAPSSPTCAGRAATRRNSGRTRTPSWAARPSAKKRGKYQFRRRRRSEGGGTHQQCGAGPSLSRPRSRARSAWAAGPPSSYARTTRSLAAPRYSQIARPESTSFKRGNCSRDHGCRRSRQAPQRGPPLPGSRPQQAHEGNSRESRTVDTKADAYRPPP